MKSYPEKRSPASDVVPSLLNREFSWREFGDPTAPPRPTIPILRLEDLLVAPRIDRWNETEERRTCPSCQTEHHVRFQSHSDDVYFCAPCSEKVTFVGIDELYLDLGEGG